MQILLIEDNLTIIKGLTYTLKQNNYEVYACKNLFEAISYLKDNPKINLIILDVTSSGKVLKLVINLSIPDSLPFVAPPI